MTWIGCVGLAVVGLLLFVGCPQQGADRPATYGVSGTVTLDGSAVEGATVTFSPSGGKGTPAVGKTDASGRYSLKSFGTEEGAIPGQYAVTVTKYEFAGAGGGGEYGGAADTGEQGGKNQLPANYASPTESKLTATVTENASSNVFDFALTSGGAAPAAAGGAAPTESTGNP